MNEVRALQKAFKPRLDIMDAQSIEYNFFFFTSDVKVNLFESALV